ncbi:MAG: phosphopantetheine-binding protein [Actinomycetota bacterium]|nr:phosphopantetheine-binding protein [Actinomycetota bacterium]
MSAVPGEVRERVVREVRRLAPRPADHVDASSDLENDLGFDSLTLVELALAIEREFDLPPLTEGDAIEIATVGDIQEIVVRTLGEGPA